MSKELHLRTETGRKLYNDILERYNQHVGNNSINEFHHNVSLEFAKTTNELSLFIYESEFSICETGSLVWKTYNELSDEKIILKHFIDKVSNATT